MNKRLIFGIDFDGTLVSEAFPGIGELNNRVLELMKLATEQGHLVIIWTARSGKALDEAVQFMKENTVPYHYINENPEDEYAIRGEQGRKIFCNYYLDDRAVNIKDVESLFEILDPQSIVLPKIAILTGSFSIKEVGTDEEDICHFNKGMKVLVLRKVKSCQDIIQYVIYSEELNEATTVAEYLLEFV